MKTLEITTAYGTYLVLDLPEDSVTCTIAIVGNIFIIDGLGVFFDLPDYNYKIAGYGKGHPELVEELSLKTELSHKCAYGCAANDNSCGLMQSGKCEYEIESERKYVFKNPFILKKNESKS